MAKKKMYRMTRYWTDWSIEKYDKSQDCWESIAELRCKKDAQAFLKYKEGEK